MVVLEAARAIAQSGLKPKRTIRFILFSGEEEGLLGSRAYAAAHAAEADSIQAVLVLDNGTGAITGQALQGRDELADSGRTCWRRWPRSARTACARRCKGGTDHLSLHSLRRAGLQLRPGMPRGYNHTHHSQSDTYDKAVPDDLKQASAVMAVTAYELANLPELLPRGPKHRAGGRCRAAPVSRGGLAGDALATLPVSARRRQASPCRSCRTRPACCRAW